jgi:drug/metabolite transporter (DMT)-like permease
VTSPNRQLWPTLAITLSAFMSGLIWIPLRQLEREGLQSGWVGLLLFSSGLLVMAPFALALPRKRRETGWGAVLVTGICNGGAYATYAASLLLTDVVRTLLLFYMAPIWGALLGILFLGERLTAARIGAIALCIGGLMVILGFGHGWPWPRNAGDWLALISGMMWAYAALRVLMQQDIGSQDQTVAAMLGGLVVAGLLLLMLPAGAAGPNPPLTATVVGGGFAVAALMLVPVNWLAVWSARFLPPARVCLIFALEAVIGIGSAAMLTDEPFGWREVLGSLLVIGGTVLEVAGQSRQVAQAAT